MNMKLLSAFLITAVLLSSLVFAAVVFTAPDSVAVTKKGTTLQVDNTGEVTNFTATLIGGSSQTLDGKTINLAVTPIGSADNVATSLRYNITLTGSDLTSFPVSEFSRTLNITGISNAGSAPFTKIVTLNFQTGFCSNGPAGANLSIKDVDVSNSGDKDEEWMPLDVLSIDVDVENNGNDDIDDVIVEMGLFDSAGRNVVNDLDFTSSDEEEADLGNLGDDDDDTVSFEFKVPADFDSGNYKLAFKAYSDDTGQARDCSDEFQGKVFTSISVKKETDDEKTIVVDDIELPAQATCGETISGAFTVFNIGSQNEDQVKIQMRNAQLGISQDFVIREDLDEGDDKTLEFNFEIPDSATDGNYNLEFTTFYDYDDNSDDYDVESEDKFLGTLKVIGCSPDNTGNPGNVDSGSASITASLDSDAKAGEQLTITARVRNTGDSDGTFIIALSGYEDWASLDDVSERLLNLDAGESAEVTIVFNVDEDADGTQSFFIETDSNGSVDRQEVEVDVTSKSLSFDFGGNNLIWIIGAINVILLILVIVVAIRLAKR
ncbi:MAG: putative S-layer protein [Nanoarchaeota archaeon]